MVFLKLCEKVNFEDTHEWFLPLTLKVKVGGCGKLLPPPPPHFWPCQIPEVESSRTSLASRTSSRTHFEVLGLGLGLESQVLGLSLGLEASSPRKLPCPRLEDSTIFWTVEFRWKTPETSQKICEHLLVFLTWSIGVAKGRGTGVRPLPNWNFTNDKMWQKSL